MKVMLIVKGDSITRVYEEISKWLPTAETIDADHRLRLGAYRVDVNLPAIMVIEVYQWFNDCPRAAPFPEGTLLFFTGSP